MLVFPTSVEVNLKTYPYTNLAIIGICAVVLLFFGTPEVLVLASYNPLQLIGYQFAHAGLFHLLGNMLFLWVFGNAVLDKVGNLWFPVIFLATGVVAGVAQMALDGVPTVGASGAVNGIIGFYLVVYPKNRVHLMWFFFLRGGEFSLPGFVLILFWFFMDNLGAFGGGGAVAYWAHVGGFVAGFFLGWIFLVTGGARMAHYDNETLLELWGLPIKSRSTKPVPVFPSAYELQAAEEEPEDPNAEIEVTCPYCNEDLEVMPEFVGSIFQCPACGEDISVSAD